MNIATKIRKNNKRSSVFTVSDIKTLLNEYNNKSIYNSLFYAVNKGEIYKISDGIYSFDKEYSKKEFGNRFRKPSYISLYTVLQDSGIVFQPYFSIFLVSNRSETVEIDGNKYIYRKIKDEILLNPIGIINIGSVQIATPERAICDKIYLDGEEYFDNLRNIKWDFMKKINKLVYSNNKVISKYISKHSK